MSSGAFYDYSPTTGVVIPDTPTIRERVSDMFKAAFGANFDTSNHTPAGVLVDSLTQLFAEQTGIIAQCANGFDINLAIGKWLDGIGTILDVSRHPLTATTFKIKIYQYNGSDMTFPSGSILVYDADGNAFTNVAALTTDGSEFYEVTFESSNLGSMEYDLSSISFKSFESYLRVYDGSVPYDIVEGADEESDDAYRQRLMTALSRGTGYRESVSNAIMSADESVIAVKVGKNYSCAYVEQDGIVYPPCSCCIVVRNPSNATAIQNAIAASVPFGCGFCKDAGVTAHIFQMEDEDGNGYEACWHEAEAASVDVSVSATLFNYPGTSQELRDTIQAKITEYFNSVGLGGTVKTDDAALTLQDIPGVKINYVRFNESGSTWADSITMPIANFPTPTMSYVFSFT